MAKGALMMWVKSEACGANDTGCGVPMTNPPGLLRTYTSVTPDLTTH